MVEGDSPTSPRESSGTSSGVADLDLATVEGKRKARAVLGKSFRPHAPTQVVELFAGRTEQLTRLMDLTHEDGRHGIVYGEPGVGKTSLAEIATILCARWVQAHRVQCASESTFGSLWAEALRGVPVESERARPGFNRDVVRETGSARALLPDEPTPGLVVDLLDELSSSVPLLLFFDEFDRIESSRVRRQMADTVKGLSDRAAAVTVVFVGVADSVEDLIVAHQSVERALNQIKMPRMSQAELRETVSRGLAEAGMTIQPSSLETIIELSRGLPHYVHLISLQAGIAAVQRGSSEICESDVNQAIARAVDQTEASLAESYRRATASPQSETLYSKVLLAAALAPVGERGYFAPAALREPLSQILGRSVGVGTYTRHLAAFCAEDRGRMLTRTGKKNAWQYRFTNPLHQPYITMLGYHDGLIGPRLASQVAPA